MACRGANYIAPQGRPEGSGDGATIRTVRQRITPKAESAQNDAFPGTRKKPPTTKAKSKMGTDSVGLESAILGERTTPTKPHTKPEHTFAMREKQKTSIKKMT
jgi:hypothetical protein